MAKREGDTSVEDEIDRMISVGDDDDDDETGGTGGGGGKVDDLTGEEDDDDKNKGKKKPDGVSGDGTKKDGVDAKDKDKGKGKEQKDGHLRDANGNIIARAGGERRTYEMAMAKLKKYDETDIPALKAQIEAFEKAANYKEYGLDATGAASALKLYAAFIADPEKTLKWMLTQTQAKGIKVDIGGGTGITPEAIKSMIAEATAPLRKQEERDTADAKAKEEAKKEYDSFVTRFPDAEAQADGIAFLLNKNPSLSLDGAYYQLKLLFKERGMDWNIPLSEHAKAAQGKNGKGQQRQQQRTMPRGSNTQGDEMDDADNPKLASVDASYDEIIRQELKRAGVG